MWLRSNSCYRLERDEDGKVDWIADEEHNFKLSCWSCISESHWIFLSKVLAVLGQWHHAANHCFICNLVYRRPMFNVSIPTRGHLGPHCSSRAEPSNAVRAWACTRTDLDQAVFWNNIEKSILEPSHSPSLHFITLFLFFFPPFHVC